jgi:hypothetical protein
MIEEYRESVATRRRYVRPMREITPSPRYIARRYAYSRPGKRSNA